MKCKNLIISYIILFLVSASCSNHGNKNLSFSYIKYLTIETDPDINRLITIYDELYQLNGSDFIRIGYSINQRLFVHYKEMNEGVFWMAFENYSQELEVRSFIEIYSIPRTEDAALKMGFKLINEGKYKRDYLYHDNKTEAEISYTIAGNPVINKFEKKINEDKTIILFPIIQTHYMEDIDKQTIQQIFELKERAKHGEKFHMEAKRGSSYDFLKYKDIVLNKIKEILKYFDKYYLGLVDLGSTIFSYKEDLEMGEYYLKKAIQLSPERGEAYGYLAFIYKVLGEDARLANLTEELNRKLSNTERFRVDQIMLLLLHSGGNRDESIKILKRMEAEYKDVEFNKRIEMLKKMIHYN